MAAIIGHSGSCTVDAGAVGTAKIWSLDVTGDTADVTTFASAGWKENAQTLKGWSGTITVIFDGGADTGEASLITGLTSGTAVALVLSTSAAGAGTAEKFSGDAVVTSMPITNDVNGVIEVAFAFVGTGALTPAAIV
jgi:hypothetical protein